MDESTRSIRGVLSMTSAAYVERGRSWGRFLEDREASRAGVPIRQARPSVARRTGVATGTLASLRNGRLKAIAAHVYDRLRAAVERELVAEMQALEHELQTLRQTGADPRSPQVAEAETHLAAARRALGMEVKR